MAIAFDAASSGFGAGPLTFSHTCTGSDRVLFVAASRWGGALGSAMTATYNGVAMSELWYPDLHVRVFYLVAPATGANDVVLDSSGNTNDHVAASVSYTGVDQTTPWDGLQFDRTVTSTPSVAVTSASGNLVVGGVISAHNAGAPTSTAGADQTERVDVQSTNQDHASTISDEAGGASVTHSYTLSATPGFNSDIWAVNVIAAGGGSGLSVPAALYHYRRRRA